MLWLFCIINPAHTNAAWPGLGLAPPPMLVGDRPRQISPVERARYLQEGFIKHRLLEWRESVDDATIACLAALGYNGEYEPSVRSMADMIGLQSPRQYLEALSKGRIRVPNVTVVTGIQAPFSVPVSHRTQSTMGIERPSLRLSSRFSATRLDAKVLQVRPMGTTNYSNTPSASSALIAKIEHCWAPILSDFREFYQLSDSRMVLIMSNHHVRNTRSGQRQRAFESRVSIGEWPPVELNCMGHNITCPARRGSSTPPRFTGTPSNPPRPRDGSYCFSTQGHQTRAEDYPILLQGYYGRSNDGRSGGGGTGWR